ncbi:hypothetical protein C8R43DRAFT_1116288 [Mycena crocata]|nr:hypothetical protein C8R43DRAFT_1116288 [Mycena crocata]
MHWTFVEPNSYYDWTAQPERKRILHQWQDRDRSKIRSYADLLILRNLRDARLACSHAIAGRRRAIDFPDDFQRWLDYQAMVNRPFTGWSGWSGPLGAHERTLWTYDLAPWRRVEGWGGDAGIELWRRNFDFSWNGVRVQKTPGKKKRRKEHLRREKEKGRAADEAYEAAVRSQGLDWPSDTCS